MSTEPTRADAASIERGRQIAESMMDDATAAYRRRLAEECSETTHAPAVDPVEPPAGPERGTGGPEAHRTAQAIEGLANEFSPTLAEIAAWANSARREIDAAHFDVKTAVDRIAKVMRPVHLREAAASLRAIADADEAADPPIGCEADYLRGWRHAANLLDSTATDLEDEGATS